MELSDLQGETLAGRFSLGELVEEGGYGGVFRTVQLSIHRTCAVKVLKPQYCTMDKTVRRFRREAEMTSELKHPNTIVVHDFGHDDQCSILFLAMEYIDGTNLRDWVGTDGPLDVDTSLHIARQVAGSLREAHELEMVHRDVKPHNLMLTSQADGRPFVKVIDFGIAKALRPELLADGGETLTRTDHVVGTPKYISPEQIRDESAITSRADQYALAVTLYYALTSEIPFDGENDIQIATRHIEQDPPPITSLVPGLEVSRDFEHALLKALSKQPEERFETVLHFVRALDRATEGDREPIPMFEGGETEDEEGSTTNFPRPRVGEETGEASDEARGETSSTSLSRTALEQASTLSEDSEGVSIEEATPSRRELASQIDDTPVEVGSSASEVDPTLELEVKRSEPADASGRALSSSRDERASDGDSEEATVPARPEPNASVGASQLEEPRRTPSSGRSPESAFDHEAEPTTDSSDEGDPIEEGETPEVDVPLETRVAGAESSDLDDRSSPPETRGKPSDSAAADRDASHLEGGETPDVDAPLPRDEGDGPSSARAADAGHGETRAAADREASEGPPDTRRPSEAPPPNDQEVESVSREEDVGPDDTLEESLDPTRLQKSFDPEAEPVPNEASNTELDDGPPPSERRKTIEDDAVPPLEERSSTIPYEQPDSMPDGAEPRSNGPDASDGELIEDDRARILEAASFDESDRPDASDASAEGPETGDVAPDAPDDERRERPTDERARSPSASESPESTDAADGVVVPRSVAVGTMLALCTLLGAAVALALTYLLSG